jgi:hypothetical protein
MLKPIAKTGAFHEISFLKYWIGQWDLSKTERNKTTPGFFHDPSYWDGTASAYIKKTKDKKLQLMSSEVVDFMIGTGLVSGLVIVFYIADWAFQRRFKDFLW